MKKKSVIFLLLLSLIWMFVIFYFSSQPAEESTETSLMVGTAIGQVVVPGFSELPSSKQREYAESIEFPVRKAAHATEFAGLGVLYTGVMICLQRKRYWQLGWLFGTIYAATDEFHQLFVPGRSGQMQDVMLDGVGCLLGCLIVGILYDRHKEKTTDK